MAKSTFAIKTLGCKVNQYEEQVLRENALRMGLEESGLHDADLCIINSCTVTGEADRKTERIIRKVKRDNPDVKILVTGCYAVLDEDIARLQALPEVNAVVPGGEKMKLLSALGGFKESTPLKEEVTGFSGHTRAFLKVQDGCDQRCSYCKVNIVRGSSRSRPEVEVLDEFRRLTDEGYKEIVLTGICLGSWRGRKDERIGELVNRITETAGDSRVRLSSIEPNHIDDFLIETIAASSRVCSHLHVPLQSGSDRVLEAMKRSYTSCEFHEVVSRIRKRLPLAGVTVDVIAGFPGESEEDHKRTCEFIQALRPSRLHVFRYSDRKGTASYSLPGKVPAEIAKGRVDELIGLGKELEKEFCHKFLAREVEVLVERQARDGLYEGYTGEYARVRSGELGPFEGEIVRVKAGGVSREDAYLIPDSWCKGTKKREKNGKS